MARKYEDFDEPEQDGVFDQVLTIVGRHKKGFALASVSTAVILLGLMLWGTYPGSEDQSGDVSVPIVRADAGDYKTTPENPGGMEIPYRDSTVFSSGEEANDTGTENILAEDTSEEPVPRSQLFAGLNTEEGSPAAVEETTVSAADQTGGEVEEIEQQLAKAEPVTTPDSTDALVKEAIGSEPDTKELAAATNPEAAKSATAEKPAKVEPIETAKAEIHASNLNNLEPAAGAATGAKAVTPGGYYVQLASVRAESGAAGEWKKLNAKYNALDGLKYRTQEANLGAKGTFYRIQAGPMSKESASDICAKIKKQTPGACLVTK